MGHIADLIAHAGAQAHAAVVERGAVERRMAIIGDCAIEELVTFADAFFALSTGGVLTSLEVAIAVLLAGLIGDTFAVSRTQFSIHDAKFAGVRAVSVSLARCARVLNTSLVTTHLALLAVRVILAAGLTSNAFAVAAQLVGITVATPKALSRCTRVGSCSRTSIGFIRSILSGTTDDEERKSRNSDQARKRTSGHHKLSNGLQKTRPVAH
jgi:hypothetical protein